MATGNFSYENRIIVVTDDDYEMDNLPMMGKWDSEIDGRIVDSVDEFIFWKVGLTSGYYSDACISYYRRDNGDVVDSYMGWGWDLTSKRQIARDLAETFGFVSPSTLRKKANGTKNLEYALMEMVDYLAECEEKQVNKQLDELKKSYGYEEITCVGHLSNGESVYRKVG